MVATYRTAVQAFLSSVGHADESILHTTETVSINTAQGSLYLAQHSVVLSYCLVLQKLRGAATILGSLWDQLNIVESLDAPVPVLDEYGGELPKNVLLVLGDVASHEKLLASVCVVSI